MNPSFLPRLEQSDGVGDVRREKSGEVADKAREIAPVGSGIYQDSIEEEEVTDPRPASRVVANDPSGAGSLVEFGSENNPAYAPLRRALDEVLGNVEGERQ